MLLLVKITLRSDQNQPRETQWKVFGCSPSTAELKLCSFHPSACRLLLLSAQQKPSLALGTAGGWVEVIFPRTWVWWSYLLYTPTRVYHRYSPMSSHLAPANWNFFLALLLGKLRHGAVVANCFKYHSESSSKPIKGKEEML